MENHFLQAMLYSFPEFCQILKISMKTFNDQKYSKTLQITMIVDKDGKSKDLKFIIEYVFNDLKQ